MNKEKIYEILVTLNKEMKIPNDCFGYERREANRAIKQLQEERLISGARFAEGGQRKGPLVVWLDDAYITKDGLQFIEDYEKALVNPNNINLPNEFVSACAKIADNPASYAGFDEDGLNRIIRDLLDSAITRFGYTIADQTQQGLSGTKPGELDIRISKNGIPVAIYEGLLHDDKAWLYEHIDKAIGKYNQSGCKAVYVVEFYSNERFYVSWNHSHTNIVLHPKLMNVNEENTGLLGVKMLKGNFDWEVQKGDFYYIGVNCHAK